MNIRDLCNEFCTGLRVTEVPIGYAIATPFMHEDGDAVTVYMRRKSPKSDLVRFEDDGLIIADLAGKGFALNTPMRQEAFDELLTSHGAEFDEDDVVIYTEYVSSADAPAMFMRFMSLVIRLDDLKFLSSGRILHIFKNDIREFIESRFKNKVDFEEDASPIEGSVNYIADFVLKSVSGQTLALYAASSESKALEALLLWQESLNRDIKNLSVLAVFESSKPVGINKRTMARIMNSDVQMAAFADAEEDVVDKMKRTLELN